MNVRGTDVDFRAGPLGPVLLLGLRDCIGRAVRTSGFVEQVKTDAADKGDDWDRWAAENFEQVVGLLERPAVTSASPTMNPFATTALLGVLKIVCRVLRATGVVAFLREKVKDTATDWDDWAIEAFDGLMRLIEDA